MQSVLRILLAFGAIFVVLVVLVVVAWLRPLEASRVIWPVVEAVALGEFTGITTDGVVREGLFPIAETGVSTEPVEAAARAFLESLTTAQRERTLFAVDDDEWRRWANIHISTRQGLGFEDMTAEQKAAAWALLASGLSAKGFELARDITRLEEHLAELMNDHVQYGEHRYWVTVMGEPSSTEPWGWQFEGHHLIINFFVLGDQIVMTPTFLGAEPPRAKSGKYAGTSVLQEDQALGLALMRRLSDAQRARAIVSAEKPENNNYGELFQDNAVVPLEGLPLATLTGEPRRLAEQLIRHYVDNLRPPHAAIWMAEVMAHWNETHLAWVGGTDDEATFYYRIQSPVIMIEFDHQRPVALAGPDSPTRDHIHAVIRTPNGNDYGKDLLRQHLTNHPH